MESSFVCNSQHTNPDVLCFRVKQHINHKCFIYRSRKYVCNGYETLYFIYKNVQIDKKNINCPRNGKYMNTYFLKKNIYIAKIKRKSNKVFC